MAINPAGAVPCIKDSAEGEEDFILAESCTILRYLADTRGAADNWYPKDLKKRARVDAYLDSHHSGLRKCITGYVAGKFFAKKTDEELKDVLD